MTFPTTLPASRAALLFLGLAFAGISDARDWTTSPTRTDKVQLAKASFEITVPAAMTLDDRFLQQNMADWKPSEGKSWEGPGISVNFELFPPRDLDAAKTQAPGSRKVASFDAADATNDGYELIYRTTDGRLQVSRFRKAAGRMLHCRAQVPLDKSGASVAATTTWLQSICSSMTPAGGGAPTASPSSGGAPGSAFRDASTGLSLSLSNGWKGQKGRPGEPIQIGSSAEALSKGPGPDRAAAMLFTGTIAQMGTDPAALVDGFMAKTTKGAKDVPAASSLRVNGRPAARANWSGTVAGVKATYSIWAVVGQKNVVLLMGVDGSGGRKLAEIAEIAQSIRID